MVACNSSSPDPCGFESDGNKARVGVENAKEQ